MRTINSFAKIYTSYSKFEYFIDDTLSAMDLSDRGKPDLTNHFHLALTFCSIAETALSKVTESKLWRSIEIERIDNGVLNNATGSALKITIGRDLLVNRFLLRWIFNNMNTNNIKKLNMRWEHLTDNELEFVSVTEAEHVDSQVRFS